jgi:hypothetical protein
VASGFGVHNRGDGRAFVDKVVEPGRIFGQVRIGGESTHVTCGRRVIAPVALP